ncbi:MAG TPA: hypothetical protein VNQ32_14280 [Steroidobacteraceae bacterium]|nr:hypothetical protein [Steroidobacteraceae bacterium]
MKKLTVFLLAASAALSVQARAPGERTAWQKVECDHACLSQWTRDYVAALVKRDASQLKQHKSLRFTENNVELKFGKEGLWATVTGVSPKAMIAADTETGNAAWLGTAEENGKPVYFALRLAVRDGQLAEAETVVVRNTGLPLPFFDVTKVEHDPTFNEILPPEQRRSRARLRAVADGYFNTVEVNDGVIFTPFAPDCGRLENGILTTAASAGAMAASTSPGCEAGLKTGMYRINKRIRERRYPLIDVERGVVVATGFFDHANEWDRYKLNDGREMNTALKWPNSISLIEAFRVRNGAIHRIEAVFSYVPHMMHNPFYSYPPAPPPTAEDDPAAKVRCDKACLEALAARFMTAMAAQKPQDIPWARDVKFTENGVGIQVGEGIWGSIRSKSDFGVTVADAGAGTVTWYGLIYDHDAPAYAGVRLKVKGSLVSEAEVIVARERNPGPWANPRAFQPNALFSSVVEKSQRTPRRALISAVEGYAKSVTGDGKVQARFDAGCTRAENGQVVTSGEVGSIGLVKSPGKYAQGCEAQLKLGLYQPLDRLRGRRVLAVDEERGLVVATAIADFNLAQRKYRLADGREVESEAFHAMSRELFEVYKIVDGRIVAIEAVSVDQPYGMPSAWSG